MKRAVVLNCSCFVFFIFFLTTSGHPKRSQEKEKENFKNNKINQQNRKKGRRPERNQTDVLLKQKRKKHGRSEGPPASR